MKPALRSATALAPMLFALAACGGGARRPRSRSRATTAAPAAPADAATPAADARLRPPRDAGERGPTPTPTAAVPAPPVAAAGPPAVFNQCAACHSTEPRQNGIGPSLPASSVATSGDAPGSSPATR